MFIKKIIYISFQKKMVLVNMYGYYQNSYQIILHYHNTVLFELNHFRKLNETGRKGEIQEIFIKFDF